MFHWKTLVFFLLMEIPVPTPGTQDAAPEATSKRANSGSPLMSLHAPNPRPMTSPTTGTALAPVFPPCFATSFPPCLATSSTPSLAAIEKS